MNVFGHLSLRNKITAIIVCTVLIILSIGFSIDVYSEARSIKNNLLAEKVLTAKIVGNYTVADIIFSSEESALESLSYLKKDSSIINAHLYDAEDNHFASLYDNEDFHEKHLDKTKSWHEFDNEKLYILEPIMLNDQRVGALCLHTSTTDYLKNVERRIKFLVGTLLMLLILAFIIAGRLASFVTSPILSLANAARNFSKDKTYKLNLKSKHEDEIGRLVNAFNDMFSQISNRENERDLAISQLKDNEANLKLILDNMVDGVITTDESGLILTMNKAAEIMFGYPAKSITGLSIKKLIPSVIKDENSDSLEHYLKTKQSRFIGIGREVEALRKNNSTFSMRLSVSELPKDANNKRRFIGSCQDLTQLMHQEEQLRRTQKMDALGKLTGGIAHDYNNMLGVITGYAELLEEELETQPTLMKYAQAIQQAGHRGAKLTRKLLSFSKQNASEPDILNINTLLLEEQHMLEKTLTVRIKLIFDLEENLWPVWLDISDMTDVILNMSINAMHAIENNGQLTISTHNETLNALDAQLLDLKPGEYTSINITDTGSGMDTATKGKIFDPFFSTKGTKGTGLGLSQVYGFVKNSGGAINVYSEIGLGTRFALYFPRYNAGSKKQEAEIAEVNTDSLEGNQRILIVDDEPALINLCSEILQQKGYLVFSAENAKKALEILEQEPIDLLLSDVIMPEMNGYELASIVQSKYPDIKIQLASGFTDDRHVDKTDLNLQKNILKKPYNSHELLKKVYDLLN